MPAHGGWHDAGDTLKYLITSSNATAQLLLAYTVNPAMWKDRTNDLGQPVAAKTDAPQRQLFLADPKVAKTILRHDELVLIALDLTDEHADLIGE